MSKKLMTILALSMVMGLTTPVWAQDTGLIIPVPIFTEAGVKAEVIYDSATGLYTYSYTITNPSTNTGEIYDIDIRMPRGGGTLSSEGLTMPRGSKTRTFDQVLSIRRNPKPMVPVGIVAPSGWDGGLGNRGVAGFGCGNETPNILPGETKGRFELISRGLPTIREAEIEPWWIFYKKGSASEEDAVLAREIEESLKFITKTIGPTAPPRALSFIVFLENIEDYIDESVTLGWIIDSALVSTLQAKLDTARSFIQADDPTKAKLALGEFMDLVGQASPSQLT